MTKTEYQPMRLGRLRSIREVMNTVDFPSLVDDYITSDHSQVVTSLGSAAVELL